MTEEMVNITERNTDFKMKESGILQLLSTPPHSPAEHFLMYIDNCEGKQLLLVIMLAYCIRFGMERLIATMISLSNVCRCLAKFQAKDHWNMKTA
jgi:hypothetical protein